MWCTGHKRKRGVIVAVAHAQEGKHSDSNSILPPISLISSFLCGGVLFRKSAAVVFAQKESLPAGITMERVWKVLVCNQVSMICSSTYTYFCPLIIRIRLWYHFQLETHRKEIISTVRVARRVQGCSKSHSEETFKDIIHVMQVSDSLKLMLRLLQQLWEKASLRLINISNQH